MIGRVCWFVRSLYCLFVRDARCDFPKSPSLIFMKFGTDVEYLCQMKLLIFWESRSKLPYTENLSLVITRLWYKISLPNLAV